MKCFELIQYYFAIVGIDSQHANQKCLLNQRNVMVIIIFGLTFICKIVYLFHGVKTLVEYTESLYVVSTLVATILAFAIIIWKMPKLFEFIDNFENTIEERKWISTCFGVRPVFGLVYVFNFQDLQIQYRKLFIAKPIRGSKNALKFQKFSW